MLQLCSGPAVVGLLGFRGDILSWLLLVVFWHWWLSIWVWDDCNVRCWWCSLRWFLLPFLALMECYGYGLPGSECFWAPARCGHWYSGSCQCKVKAETTGWCRGSRRRSSWSAGGKGGARKEKLQLAVRYRDVDEAGELGLGKRGEVECLKVVHLLPFSLRLFGWLSSLCFLCCLYGSLTTFILITSAIFYIWPFPPETVSCIPSWPWAHCIAGDDWFPILLPLSPEFWDYGRAHLILFGTGVKLRSLSQASTLPPGLCPQAWLCIFLRKLFTTLSSSHYTETHV